MSIEVSKLKKIKFTNKLNPVKLKNAFDRDLFVLIDVKFCLCLSIRLYANFH